MSNDGSDHNEDEPEEQLARVASAKEVVEQVISNAQLIVKESENSADNTAEEDASVGSEKVSSVKELVERVISNAQLIVSEGEQEPEPEPDHEPDATIDYQSQQSYPTGETDQPDQDEAERGTTVVSTKPSEKSVEQISGDVESTPSEPQKAPSVKDSVKLKEKEVKIKIVRTPESVKAKMKKPDNPNGPFHARPVDERAIIKAMQKVPPRHEYVGYLYSAQSQRPPNYYRHYHLPIYKQPQPRQHVIITGEVIPPMKIFKNIRPLKNYIPLSAVKVKWRSNRLSTVYKLEDIYAYLASFGPIDGVYGISPNSAMVIFTDVEAARSAVMSPCLGFPWDPLLATWMDLRMYNHAFYSKYLVMEETSVRVRI
ncbi:uncharacterized protein LOC131937718 isoform X2 [Physella acuta]|uniref:uncharacterized protein LOC131937718 isoform X2 n=1 Tax=Physella acuta TaxID=109671 RepID=UPI0027DD2192|nr:uncharacterized protein LOC131937718 isoform X2 [Physella acuta]